MIESKLESIGIATSDIFAATTDAGSNVLKAVKLMGLRTQKCFAHGLDLVIRKVVRGKKASAFDVLILNEHDMETQGDSEDSNSSDSDSDDDSEDECDADETLPVSLGEAVQ